MSAPKKGDRVDVAFGGVVESVYPDAVSIQRPDGSVWLAPIDACTVIVPPIALHDVVTAENIGQLPDGSIIAEPNCAARTKWDGLWIGSADGMPTLSDIDAVRLGAVVLRIGGGV